jgi:hypothetical protein
MYLFSAEALARATQEVVAVAIDSETRTPTQELTESLPSSSAEAEARRRLERRPRSEAQTLRRCLLVAELAEVLLGEETVEESAQATTPVTEAELE